MIQWLRVTASRLRAVFTKQRLDRDFEDELRDHLESLTEEYEAGGMSRGEARRRAVLKLGHPEQLREANRDHRGMPLLETLAQDLGFAFRTLRKSRGFTAVAVLTVALGIGLCSFLFSFMNGMVLRPLPGAREPGRLVALEAPVTYRYFERYRNGTSAATATAAFIGPAPFGVAVDNEGNARPERIFGHLVSPEYFSTLGVKPFLGRFFDATLDRPGAAPTVVVSERFWRARLNADPHPAGRILRINGHRATVVGVAQKDFLGLFPANPADIFVPVTADPAVAPELAGDVLHNNASPVFRVVLRLAPHVTMAAAEAELDTQTRQLDHQSGKRNPNPGKQGRVIQLVMAGGIMPTTIELRSLLFVFWGLLMALILSFTCANLAGLMLARGSARSREIAIRLSVGASRFRLIRQLLMESLVLAIIGGAAGLAVAYGLLNLLMRLLPSQSAAFPSQIHLTPDLRVALLTFFVSTLAGAGFGLMPALATTRLDLVAGLKETAAANLGRYRRFGLRNLFMVYQMAAAMLLVLITGFAVIGLQRNTNREDPGFDTAGLYLFSLDPARDGYSPDESAAVLAGLPDRLSHVSGVQGVSLTDQNAFNYLLPGQVTSVRTPSGITAAAETAHRVKLQLIGPNFFATLGVPVPRGAEFTSRDLRSDPAAGTMLPAVINQTAARELFGDAGPLGRIIHEDQNAFQVAGVVRYDTPAPFRKEPDARVFLPVTMKELRQGSAQGSLVVVRARKGMDFAAIRGELKAIDTRLTMINPQTMREYIAVFDRALHYTTAIYGGVGMFALVLACVGLAGVTAQAVVRRRREIGIRMALGARRPQVLRLVMKEGAAMVLVGSALGIAGAGAIIRVLVWAFAPLSQANASGALDPMQVVGAPLLLIAVAALACYVPARRSASIDPLAALREE